MDCSCIDIQQTLKNFLNSLNELAQTSTNLRNNFSSSTDSGFVNNNEMHISSNFQTFEINWNALVVIFIGIALLFSFYSSSKRKSTVK